MRLKYFLAAEYATFDETDRLTLHRGDIGEIRALRVPFDMDQIYLAGKLIVDPSELGQDHILVIRPAGDGERIEGMEEAPLRFRPIRRPDKIIPNPHFGFALRIVSPRFARAGLYGFEVLVDGQLLGRLDLYVSEFTSAT